MFVIYLCIFSVLYTQIACDNSEEHQYHEENEQINPINESQDNPAKDHDKRTIFPKHHGWAKHVGVHPSGFKYVIGYGPVDLKYVPVVKPVTIRAHHHHIKVHSPAKWHVKPLIVKPVLPVRPVVHHDGWKPIVPVVKPVVPINVPPPAVVVKPVHHVDVVHHKPVHHVDVVKPVHHVDVVQPVHHVDVVHNPHVDFVHHVDVVKPAPVPLRPLHPYPVWQVPTAPAVPIHNPALISPGTTISHYGNEVIHAYALAQPAPAHIHPAEVHPAQFHAGHIHPAHIHPAEVHPNIAEPVLQPHIHHQPELHHAHLHPQHIHPEPAPHAHALLPEHAHFHHQHLVPQQGPYFYHENVPGINQHLFNQQIQHGDGATSSVHLHGATIQPGHTDVQVPVHLPAHPNYLPDGGRHFHPSISLEAPFAHK